MRRQSATSCASSPQRTRATVCLHSKAKTVAVAAAVALVGIRVSVIVIVCVSGVAIALVGWIHRAGGLVVLDTPKGFIYAPKVFLMPLSRRFFCSGPRVSLMPERFL